ncbi:hypothetical protein [Opitutus sp. ER46]|uniref:hypothetical protein n=1 Tax=Opitutus sp. ER46 TaxID=2161864 RepID=UPI000D2FA366|nr:hypothetical protein [Opitutus sp. ER46]PTX91157.1 hypothetical protein DB354_21235 [Opitutus sp. ER46]
MQTLVELYCARHRCTADEFRRRLFWEMLPPHTRWLAALLGGYNADCFDADRDFIAALSALHSYGGLHEELRDFALDARNETWLRRHLKVRMSCRRVKQFAKLYLPDARDSIAPFPASPEPPTPASG